MPPSWERRASRRPRSIGFSKHRQRLLLLGFSKATAAAGTGGAPSVPARAARNPSLALPRRIGYESGFMLTDLEDPPDAPQLWSWKKILVWFLGILALILALLLLWDEKLQPYPELTQHRRNMPPEAANGYFMLTAAWSSLSKVSGNIQRKWKHMELAREPWDSTVADMMNPDARDLGADLTNALTAPEWMVPPRRNPLTDEDAARPIREGILSLRAAAFQRLLEGKAEPALSLIENLRQLSRRQTAGANDSQALWIACMTDFEAATLTAQLMLLIPQSDANLLHLTECWADEHLSQADFGPPTAGESELFVTCLENGAGLLYLESWRKWRFDLTTKRNRTINRMNRILSGISTDSLTTAAERHLTLYAETDRLKEETKRLTNPFDINWGGHAILVSSFTGFDYGPSIFITLPRQKLFAARAARMAVALKRWQQAHGGSMPERLTALVPDFLPAIPSDPWNGQPLQWHPASSVIFAVGETWKPSGPASGEFGISGLGLSHFGRIRFSLDPANAARPPARVKVKR